MLLFKRAYSVKITSEIPEADMELAENSLEKFSEVTDLIDKLIKHLNKAFDSFSKLNGMDVDTVDKYRYVFRGYRDVTKEMMDNIMKKIVSAMKDLYEPFSSDPQVNDLFSALDEGITETTKLINILLGILSDFNDKEFHKKLIKTIEDVLTSLGQLKKVIDDRVIQYINRDVLNKNWKSFAKEFGEVEINENLPFLAKLFKERTDFQKGD